MWTERENEKGSPSERLLIGLTDRQREAVCSRGRVLVSASAGSGKTTTMVRKIIAEAEKGIPLSDMLILVYNEAAASELKERLHGALFDAACAADGSKREFLRANIDAISSASIGTIHAFCRALIKANFQRLGVSPSFDIIGEGEEARYKAAAMDAVFAGYSERGDAVFAKLADALTAGRREDNFRKVVEELYGVTEIQPDRAEFLRKVRESYREAEGGGYAEALAADARERMSRWRRVLESVLPVLRDEGQSSYEQKVMLLLDSLKVSERADLEGVGRIADAATEALAFRASKKRGSESDAVELVKQTVNAAKSFFADRKATFSDMAQIAKMHLQNAEFVDKLLEIVENLDAEFSAAKRADDVMTYADLEYYAAELVRSGDFAGRYKEVFVDEYQDVNPVQEFIIGKLLPADAFMVGDVKQSIYAFRLADPEIFLERKRRYEKSGEGKAIEFNANFRSVPAVLDFVNGIFDVAMTAENSGVDYQKEGRFEVTDDRRDIDGNVLSGGAEVHLFAAEGTLAAAYAEARFIASEIRKLTSSAKRDDGAPIGYGDCVVLVRSRSRNMKKLAGYLAEEGIPVDAGIFEEESSRPEEDLIRFLTVLDNPRNDIPLAGFMLSYFGGFDESELAVIAGMRPEGGDLYDAVLAASKEESLIGRKTADMLAMLAGYRLKASFKSVPELLQSIVSDFDFDACARAMGEGSSDRVIAFITEKATKDSYAGIGRFLSSYASSEGRRRTSRPEGGDKVRFATYHAYKGLEAPVVFVAGADRAAGRRGAYGDVMTDNRGYVGMAYFDFERRAKQKTLSLAALSAMKAARERRDETRLYYVALTRAKQYLYVTGRCPKSQLENFGAIPLPDPPVSLLDHIREAKYEGKMFVLKKHYSEDPAPYLGIYRELPPVGEADDDASARIKKAMSFSYPHRAATSLSMKYSVSALDGGGDELTLGAFADRADEGILYHKIMEHIDFEAEGRAGVEAELDRMTSEGVLTEAERAATDVGAIAECLASPVMRLARKSVCYRERSFLMYLPANEVGGESPDDKVLVQGVIDLLIDGEERVIVDFKNSALRNAEAMEKYKKQLYLYKKAVENSFLGKVDRVVLYSFKTGKTVEL